MKRLSLLILLITLSLTTLGNKSLVLKRQSYSPKTTRNYTYNTNNQRLGMGAGMMIAGASFIILGVTANDAAQGIPRRESTISQEPTSLFGILAGSALIVSGIVISF